jgi:hypothetical protein
LIIDSANKNNSCPICGSEASHLLKPNEVVEYNCSRCGEYNIIERISDQFFAEEYSNQVRINISSWISEHQNIFIQPEDVDFLKNLKTPTLVEKANKLLLLIANNYPLVGKKFSFNEFEFRELLYQRKLSKGSFTGLMLKFEQQGHSSKYLAASWAYDYEELCFILQDYLIENLKYIETDSLWTDHIITPFGWEHIEKLKELNPISNIAFVAMWFDTSTNDLYQKAIEPAIISAGYTALRVDRHEHNNKIDDEIIAGIRRSKFVVCDFTGQRGGVYFESGYALGFGVQVIWICRKDELDKIHFDNRQYNFLTWEPDKLEEFKKALQNRIEATIGRPSQS